MSADQKETFRVLRPNQFEQWYDGIRRFAEHRDVWSYVDPSTAVEAPKHPAPPRCSNVNDGAVRLEDLWDDESSVFRNLLLRWELTKGYNDVKAKRIDEVFYEIKRSTRRYKSLIDQASDARAALKALRNQNALALIARQDQERARLTYRRLLKPPPKSKVDRWVLDWIGLNFTIDHLGMKEFSKTRMVEDFLRAGRKWAPSFCETYPMVWMQMNPPDKEMDDVMGIFKSYRMRFLSDQWASGHFPKEEPLTWIEV